MGCVHCKELSPEMSEQNAAANAVVKTTNNEENGEVDDKHKLEPTKDKDVINSAANGKKVGNAEEKKADEPKKVIDDEAKKGKEEDKKSVPEPDMAQLNDKFKLFSKFGDKSADGSTIKLSQSDKWFKQAGVIQTKGISTTDTGIAFRKVSKKAPKISFVDWNKYLDEIATAKKMNVNTIKTKLVECGEPGFTGGTKVAKSAAVNRLTDASKYGGAHKERFDSTGKGKGKEGREDAKSDGYVKGYKNKKGADDKMR